MGEARGAVRTLLNRLELDGGKGDADTVLRNLRLLHGLLGSRHQLKKVNQKRGET